MYSFQIDSYVFISVYIYVRICECSLGRASRNFNKQAVFLL